jgi:hypothetical protein
MAGPVWPRSALSIEHLDAETTPTLINMKILVAIVLVGFGVSAHAGILAGPIINPANSHIYYLLSQSITKQSAERPRNTLNTRKARNGSFSHISRFMEFAVICARFKKRLLRGGF